MKKKLFFILMIVMILINSMNCFAENTDTKYPVKVNTFKENVDFSNSKDPQTISFKVDSDIENAKLNISVVDTAFELQNGKTIFTETTPNPELEKYLKFDYNPVVDIVPGGTGTDINISITPIGLPEGNFYKGIKISYTNPEKTAISSVLIPVVIKNLVPGKHYSINAKIDYIRLSNEADYVIKTPFEICVGLTNSGDKAISSLDGTLTIKDSEGKTVNRYPIANKSTFFAGAPKELRIPITNPISDGKYTAEAVVKYDLIKSELSEIGVFEVRTNLSDAVGKDKPTIIVKNEIPTWVIILIAGVGLLLIIIILILIFVLKKKSNKNRR